MDFREIPNPEELLKEPEVFISAVSHSRRLIKPWTVERVVATPIAKCGHEQCPAMDLVEYHRGWTRQGVLKGAVKKFRKQVEAQKKSEEQARQRAASESLGG